MTRSASERASTTPEGDIRAGFFGAYDATGCEYVPLFGAECDRRLREGPEMVSANFVIPYPPGFPIMVPGQVLTQETIDFMRKLDVKEIHGYERRARAEAAAASRHEGALRQRLTDSGPRAAPGQSRSGSVQE